MSAKEPPPSPEEEEEAAPPSEATGAEEEGGPGQLQKRWEGSSFSTWGQKGQAEEETNLTEAQKLILASDSTRTLGKSRAAHPPLPPRSHLRRLGCANA